MKILIVFILSFCFALNLDSQGEVRRTRPQIGVEEVRQSRPLYSMPKVMGKKKNSSKKNLYKTFAQNQSAKKDDKIQPATAEAAPANGKRSDVANALIATEAGIMKIESHIPRAVWTGGAARQILPVVLDPKKPDEKVFYFSTDKGILFSSDLENFEPRNKGLPTYVLKTYEYNVTNYETHAQDLKDLAYNPLKPLEMVTATKEAVFFTRDGGRSWKSLGAPGNTNGVKAVAVASVKTKASVKNNADPETVVFLAHPILGFRYYRVDTAAPKWIEASGGLASSDPSLGKDEVADILPVVAVDENGVEHCEIYLSQTFMPRIYKFDTVAEKHTCLYKGEEPLDTIDSLWKTDGGLTFMSPGKIAMFNIASGEVVDLSERLAMYFPKLLQDPMMNAVWVESDALGRARVAGDLLLNELWLLESGKILSSYAKKIDGQKSLYIPAHQLTYDGGVDKFKKLILENKLNSLVIDMKDDFGLLRYHSNDELVLKKGSASRYALDLDEFVKTFKENHIYLIARIVVFKDRNLSKYNNGEYAVFDRNTKRAWHGIKSIETDEETGEKKINYYDEAWVDPFCPDVWEYNVAISKELIERGFDEIQFDYIRFPTDGINLGSAQYRWQSHNMDKEGALRSFLSYARKNIAAPIGIDIYGANGWYRSGTRTGQDVETLAQYVDVICPMFYPSHFENSFMNFQPNEERPYRIYYYGTYRNTVIARDRVVVRPWIQAFFLNVPYDREYYNSDYVQKQVFGVRDSVDRGYMFWNNSGNYSTISPDPGDELYTGPSPEAARTFRKPAIGQKQRPFSFFAHDGYNPREVSRANSKTNG